MRIPKRLFFHHNLLLFSIGCLGLILWHGCGARCAPSAKQQYCETWRVLFIASCLKTGYLSRGFLSGVEASCPLRLRSANGLV